jgi:predicted phosphodiesterase
MKMTTIKKMVIDDSVEQLIVVSDLHGFVEPLKIVDRILDRSGARVQVLAAGDYFAIGPYPAETLSWIRVKAGDFAVLGNHEEGVLAASDDNDAPPGVSSPATGVPSPAFTDTGSLHCLDSGLKEYLVSLPHVIEVVWKGKCIRFTHDVTPSGEKFSWTARPDEVVDVMADLRVDLTVCGHTHYPFVRKTAGTIVANAGSVSALMLGRKLPDDSITTKGDEDSFVPVPEVYSSYLSIVIRNGELDVTVEYFEYDIEVVLRQLRECCHPNLEKLTSLFRTGVF